MIDFRMSAQEKIIALLIMSACVAIAVLSLLFLPLAAAIYITIICTMVFTAGLIRVFIGILP